MTEPIYVNEGGLWRPHKLSKGPFSGQHGGVVAGALAGAMEQHAAEFDAGPGVHMTCYLLRPAAIAPVTIEVGEIRKGRHAMVLEAVMKQDGKRVASANAVFCKRRDIAGIRPRKSVEMTPGGIEFDVGPFSKDQPWLREAVDILRNEDGMFWLRHKMPVIGNMGALSHCASLADWISGLTRPDWFGTNDVSIFPNVDLTIHLTREPQGEWLGLDGRAHWHGSSGATFAELYDQTGYLGQSAQSIVLI